MKVLRIQNFLVTVLLDTSSTPTKSMITDTTFSFLVLSHSIKTWSFITMMTQIFWDINTVSLVKSSLRWLYPLKHHELCTQWYSRTPQKTLIFTVRTFEFVFITMPTRSHHLTLFNAASHTTSERSLLISYSCLCYVSKMVFSLQVFRVKFDIHFSSPPFVLPYSGDGTVH